MYTGGLMGILHGNKSVRTNTIGYHSNEFIAFIGNLNPSEILNKCYFQRAITFRPNDATVHMVYAIYLHKSKKFKWLKAIDVRKPVKKLNKELMPWQKANNILKN